MITIGPDFKYSIGELFFINTIAFLAIRNIPDDHFELRVYMSMVILIQNIAFLATILTNPGMLNPDPTINSKIYLRRITFR